MTGEVAGTRDSAAIEKRVDDRIRVLDENLGLRFDSQGNRLEAVFAHELRRQTIVLFRMQVTVIMTMAVLVFSVVRYS